MRLLVTGGSGFLGRYVLNEAARRGHQRLAEDKAFAVDDAVRDLGYSPRPFTEGILPRLARWVSPTGTSHDRR